MYLCTGNGEIVAAVVISIMLVILIVTVIVIVTVIIVKWNTIKGIIIYRWLNAYSACWCFGLIATAPRVQYSLSLFLGRYVQQLGIHALVIWPVLLSVSLVGHHSYR